jgi:hypothetical protein
MFVNIDRYLLFDFYVACFCERGDLLSQWRGYGASGGGYALGIKTDALDSEETPSDFQLSKIIYDPSLQRQLLESVFDSAARAIRQPTPLDQETLSAKVIEQALPWVLNRAMSLVLSFKHPTFAEEREWRAIHLASGTLTRIKFRGTPTLTPYIELNLTGREGPDPLIPLDHIRHGPTLHADTTRKALRLLLNKFGYPSVRIEGSTIPLRA